MHIILRDEAPLGRPKDRGGGGEDTEEGKG